MDCLDFSLAPKASQGDLLSSCLCALVRKTILTLTSGVVEGFLLQLKVNMRKRIKILNMFYVDDSLFLCKASLEQSHSERK